MQAAGRSLLPGASACFREGSQGPSSGQARLDRGTPEGTPLPRSPGCGSSPAAPCRGEASASRAGPGWLPSMGRARGQLSLRSLSLPLGAGPQGSPRGARKWAPGRGGVGTARTSKEIKGGHRSLTVVYRGGPPRGPTALGALRNGGPRVVTHNRLLVATYLSFWFRFCLRVPAA